MYLALFMLVGRIASDFFITIPVPVGSNRCGLGKKTFCFSLYLFCDFYKY